MVNRTARNIIVIVILIIEEIIIVWWNGLFMKIAKKGFLWTSFGVKIVIPLYHILSHIDRGPMWLMEEFSCLEDFKERSSI